ncbi:right-handed parallel beta-helix repeat-containing protein [Lysobacter yangpyeongensis]|uniref:Right-handed parallel beta-helix repeat-containing protein n=1 Tax=Lysobacter yangpyeongensis TaxID=346182 RepID=A0ABW0SIK4_9GAMM
MNNDHSARHADAADRARRRFLRQSSTLALLAAGGMALPAIAREMRSSKPLPAVRVAEPSQATVYVPPSRARGSAVLDVRNYGAYGDGIHDDTAAIQRAIDALPSTGGTVVVPPGVYLIDAEKSVRLRSLMHLQLDHEAKLVARSNAADRYYVVNAYKVNDVEISGGQVIGERNNHLGSTGEWGHCVMVRGCKRVTVRDMRMADGWGDGLSIGAADGSTTVLSEDVAVANVVCSNNRRQGLTIGRTRDVRVHDSQFCYTGGIKPGCGIDIEPDPIGTSLTDGVLIQNCWIHDNAGNGIQIYKEVHDVTVRDCRIEFNQGYGVLAIGAVDGTIANNTLAHNRLYGVGLRVATTGYGVDGNTFRNNKTLYFGVTNTTTTPITVTGTSVTTNPKTTWHLEITTDSVATVGTNYYAQ